MQAEGYEDYPRGQIVGKLEAPDLCSLLWLRNEISLIG